MYALTFNLRKTPKHYDFSENVKAFCSNINELSKSVSIKSGFIYFETPHP